MDELPRPELVRPALARAGETPIEGPEGRGVTVSYGSHGGTAEALVAVVAKLTAADGDQAARVLARADRGAARAGINNMFHMVSARSPQERWKPAMQRYVEDYADFDGWAVSMINVDGRLQSAFRLEYADAATYVTDIDDAYLILAMLPAVDLPSVRLGTA